MKHILPELPFAKNALQPLMSAETLEYHHDKHHKAYVDKLNQLIPGTEFESMALEEIIANSSGAIFNQAAQVWNHTFFWHSLRPERSSPSGKLSEAIQREFGSLDSLFEKFKAKALAQFGSGWMWLVRKDLADGGSRLEIESTSNAENPLRAGSKPILTCDVWEHAYYIDYRNERARFVDAFWKLANWEFASRNFETAWELAA